MRDVLVFKGRLKPIIEISLGFMQKNPNMFAMQDTIYNLQMATYWIQEAAELIAKTSETKKEVDQAGDELLPSETPLIDNNIDQMEYLYGQCNNLATDIYRFLNDVPINALPQMWLMNAITRITEAKFCIQITAIHYGKSQDAGRDSIFKH